MIIWEHTTPTMLIMIGVAAGVLVAAFSFWRFLKPDLATLAIILLRLLFMALLVWCLFMPEKRESLTHLLKPRFVVALDKTQSMTLAPPGETRNRWAAAQEALGMDWVKAVSAECELDVYPFDVEVRPRVTIAEARAMEPDGSATLLRDALFKLADRYRGQNVAGFVLLSDGVDTREAFDDWASGMWPWPIYTLRLEPPATWEEEPDVRVDAVNTPRRVNVGWSTELKAVVSGQGTKGQAITVQLIENNALRQEIPTQIPAGGGSRQVSFQLEHPEVGVFTYLVCVPPLEGETHTNDNAYSITVQVVDNKNRLLYVEGPPRIESKFLTRALKANPKVSSLAFLRGPGGQFFTIGPRGNMTPDMHESQLAFFKIVMIGNLDARELGEHRAQNLTKFVDMGGSLILLGGPKAWGPEGLLKTSLVKLMPVKSLATEPLEGTFPVSLTDDGRSHPAFAGDPTLWDVVPPVLSVYPDAALSAGAQAIAAANTPRGMQSVIVVQRYGQGKVVAILTDSLWRWQLHPDVEKNRPYQRFWDQLLSWLSPSEKDMETQTLDLFVNKEQIFMGEDVELSAVLGGKDRQKAEASVTVEISTPSKRKIPLALARQNVVTPSGASFPGFATVFSAQEPGLYTVTAVAEIENRKVESDPLSFFVKPFTPESVPRPAKEDILRAIAQSSGGRHFEDPKDLSDFLATLKFAGKEEESVTYRSLWQNVLIISCLMALISAEWAVRKFRNLP